MVPFREVPFAGPMPRKSDVLAAAGTAFNKRHVSHGPEVEEFEAALADYFRVPDHFVVCFDSCTSAMAISHVVLRSSSVAVPCITWNATANAALLAGCSVVLLDVDEYLLAKVEDAGESYDTVCPVALYGQEPEAVYNMHSVFDYAQAFELGRVPGASSTCFSFHSLKSVPIGVGGAAIFKYEHHADEARQVRFHGVQQGREPRRQLTVGWKATMPAFAAAMGCVLLEGVTERYEHRLHVATQGYDELLDPKLFQHRKVADDAYHAYVVRVNNVAEVREELSEHGIATARYYPALQSQPFWAREHGQKYEEAMRIGEHLVALPLHHGMEQEDVEHVAGWVNQVAEPLVDEGDRMEA